MKLLEREFELWPSKVEVALTLERDEMNMSMGHFHSENRNAYSLARNGRLDGQGHLAGKSPKTLVDSLVEVEDVVVLDILRNDEHMALYKRIDVEKGVILLVFSDFVGRDFALGDAGKNRSH